MKYMLLLWQLLLEQFNKDWFALGRIGLVL